ESAEMTKEAIIAEIRKLTPEEQREIAESLWESTEENYALTDEQRAELKQRYDAYRNNPEQGSQWEDVRARIEGSLPA
ncbi:MAG: addiction module protein, partial [Spirochaetota bacterium]